MRDKDVIFLFLGLLVHATLATGAAVGAIAKPLYTILPDDTSGIKDCKPGKALVSCKKITIDFDLLKSGADISIPDLQTTMQFVKKGHQTERSHAYDYTNSAGNTAHLSVSKSGKKMHGSIKGGIYLLKITHCGGKGADCHVLKEVDTSKFVDGPVHKKGTTARALGGDEVPKARDGDTTVAEVTVKVYYTSKVAAAVTDIPGLVDLAISESNTGYQNSGVYIHLSLLCIQPSSFNDSMDVGGFSASQDSYDLIRGTADIAVLLVEADEYCGIANMAATSTGETIGIVSRQCATGYYSFGHEMGHMYGTNHDRATALGTGIGSGGSGNGYNYGYWIPNADGTASGKRTIMAYAGDGYDDRINYYSSAAGVSPDGLKLGNADTDNARVLNENRVAMAAVGSDDKTQCMAGQ